MLGYLYPLLAIIVLCSCWAIFQLWLNKVDPENQSNQADHTGACSGCEEPCNLGSE